MRNTIIPGSKIIHKDGDIEQKPARLTWGMVAFYALVLFVLTVGVLLLSGVVSPEMAWVWIKTEVPAFIKTIKEVL